MGGVDDGDEGIRRRGCSCTKSDFLPKESFWSWGNNGKALMETPMRLKDRIVTRSLDHTELMEVKARSQNEMKMTLNWWDLMWFGIGAGIFVLLGLRACEDAQLFFSLFIGDSNLFVFYQNWLIAFKKKSYIFFFFFINNIFF
jgi:hypothetical protein